MRGDYPSPCHPTYCMHSFNAQDIFHGGIIHDGRWADLMSGRTQGLMAVKGTGSVHTQLAWVSVMRVLVEQQLQVAASQAHALPLQAT